MNVIFKIRGQEAIPVRAIPLLSNWVTMGSDAIAQALAEDEHFYSFHGLKAYYAEGKLLRDIKPRMWKHEICRSLKALHESIEVAEATHESGLQEWRIGSLKVLPAGAFVWRKEFEPLYYARYRPERMPIILEDTGVMEKGEHEQRIELNFEPFVAELAIRELVMEGFEHLQPAPSAAPSSEVEHAEVETLIERIAAVKQGIDYWETRDDSKASDAEIKELKLLALRAELAPLLAKKRRMRGDFDDDEATSGQDGASTTPIPLPTGDIAFSFAGLRWDEAGWKKALGKKPLWLSTSIVIPGERGVREIHWNPVQLGAALVRAGYAKPNSVRAKFQTGHLLKPWMETWKTYEADHFGND